MTEQEKLSRRLQRKADKANDKVREEIPLFADQVPEVTRDQLFWKWRRQTAIGADQGSAWGWGNTLLDKFLESFLERLAFARIPEAAKLKEYRDHTYPSAGGGYGSSFWKKCLTGARQVVGYERTPEGKVVDRAFVNARPMPVEELAALLYVSEPVEFGEAVDPLGLNKKGGA